MVNLLTDKDKITGNTLYMVYRPGNYLPADILFRVFTNCRYTRYSRKDKEDGTIEFRCDIHGINDKGEDVYVSGWYGRIERGKTDHINKALFLTMEDAIKRKEELMNEIEQDIETLIKNAHEKAEESRKRLKEMAIATTHAHKC